MFFKEGEIDCEKFETAVLFASYEERCTNVAKDLLEKGFRGTICVMFCNDLPLQRTETHLNQIKRLFESRHSVIPVSYHNPIPAIQFAKNFNSARSALIDVSCFNRGNLFPFLWASGLGKDKTAEVTFAYSAPEHYGDWLSADYDEPKNIVGFAGGWEFARDRILICVVGFEAQRALLVIQASEPSKVILTVGTVPTREQFCERNERTVEAVHGSKNYEIREINVSDPNLCERDLQQIISAFPSGTEINFAPLSTKISCLAIWALWLRDNKIRLWNAQPKNYNQLNYSKGNSAPRYFHVVWTDS
ncbi:MAG: hypothetical protein ABIL62_18205 [Planctomycetota bacterium]